MNIEIAIAKNLEFFEAALNGLASRHFFTEAVHCAEHTLPLSLAGITCLICGIEGSLRSSVAEHCAQKRSPEDVDLDNAPNFNNRLLKKASQLGFDIEVLAFPEEIGKMATLVGSKKPPVGIVMWRNELAHGRAHRLATRFDQTPWSSPVMMAPAFREMLDISYRYSRELAKFRGVMLTCQNPSNPFNLKNI